MMDTTSLPLAAEPLVSLITFPTSEQHQAVIILADESFPSIFAYLRFARSIQGEIIHNDCHFQNLTAQKIYAVLLLKDCNDEAIELWLRAIKRTLNHMGWRSD